MDKADELSVLFMKIDGCPKCGTPMGQLVARCPDCQHYRFKGEV